MKTIQFLLFFLAISCTGLSQNTDPLSYHSAKQLSDTSYSLKKANGDSTVFLFEGGNSVDSAGYRAMLVNSDSTQVIWQGGGQPSDTLEIWGGGPSLDSAYVNVSQANDSTIILNKNNGLKDTLVFSGFNDGNIQNAISLTTNGTSGAATLSSNVLNIPAYTTDLSNYYIKSVVDGFLSNKQDKLTLTTTGTSGAATLTGSTLNIPQYLGGNVSDVYKKGGTDSLFKAIAGQIEFITRVIDTSYSYIWKGSHYFQNTLTSFGVGNTTSEVRFVGATGGDNVNWRTSWKKTTGGDDVDFGVYTPRTTFHFGNGWYPNTGSGYLVMTMGQNSKPYVNSGNLGYNQGTVKIGGDGVVTSAGAALDIFDYPNHRALPPLRFNYSNSDVLKDTLVSGAIEPYQDSLYFTGQNLIRKRLAFAGEGGGTYTVSNGLTMVGNDTRLGGALTNNSTISTGTYTINIANNSISNPGLLVTNNNTSGGTAFKAVSLGTLNGAAIVGDGTTNGAYGGFFSSSTNTGLYSSSSSGYGAFITSTSGVGTIISSGTNLAASFSIMPSSINTVVPVVSIYRATSGTASSGIGGSLDFYNDGTYGKTLSNQILSKLTDVSSSSTSEISITGYNSGTKNTLIIFSGNGKVNLNKYGSGTFTGTPVKQLSVTSSGDIIETNQPIITSGTAAPTSTPGKIGDIYVDTSAKKLYFATGNSSSSDWTIAN